jgi:hypothetical protein
MALIPSCGYAFYQVAMIYPTLGHLNGPSSGKIIKRINANRFNTLAGAAAEMNEEFSFATP